MKAYKKFLVVAVDTFLNTARLCKTRVVPVFCTFNTFLKAMSGTSKSFLKAMSGTSKSQPNASSQDPQVSTPISPRYSLFSSRSLWRVVQSSLPTLPAWKPTSEELLQETEKCLLDREVTSNYTNQYVAIDEDIVMRTIVMEPENPPALGEERTPLVMIHGFGSGLVQYYKNFDSLHGQRRLLAPDLPGFGRSTRVRFPKDSMRAEKKFVDNIERWREKVGLNTFVLLGHSLGGYLATAYTIRYPHRVRHLVLVDPWGFPSGPTDKDIHELLTPFQSFKWRMFTNMNVKPFAIVRAVGPWGPDLIKKVRKDLVLAFGETYLEYIYHCNAQNPTWAQRPMLDRLKLQLHPKVPITVIYGARTWLDTVNRNRLGKTADLIKEARPEGAYVDMTVVEEAGHHLYAEQPQKFNEAVQKVLDVVDSGRDGGRGVGPCGEREMHEFNS